MSNSPMDCWRTQLGLSQNFRLAELSSIQPLSLQQKSIVFYARFAPKIEQD